MMTRLLEVSGRTKHGNGATNDRNPERKNGDDKRDSAAQTSDEIGCCRPTDSEWEERIREQILEHAERC